MFIDLHGYLLDGIEFAYRWSQFICHKCLIAVS
jgi:hypothetical protein